MWSAHLMGRPSRRPNNRIGGGIAASLQWQLGIYVTRFDAESPAKVIPPLQGGTHSDLAI
jgi:hypothetical protein